MIERILQFRSISFLYFLSCIDVLYAASQKNCNALGILTLSQSRNCDAANLGTVAYSFPACNAADIILRVISLDRSDHALSFNA
jgi:hypothetical protein